MSRRGSNRFVISSFPQPTQLEPDFAKTTWSRLRDAISEINNRNTSNLSFEQLYRFSYNMVLHRHGDVLYDGLVNLLTTHLAGVATEIREQNPPMLLAETQRQWKWFSLSLAHVRDIMMYMDRHYVRMRHKKPVHDLGLSLFRDVVVRDPALLPRLSETLLESIDKERNGETIDTHLIKSITKMLAELGADGNGKSVYDNVFEEAFLKRTRQFYAREAKLFLAETTCSDYLRKAHRRIQEERTRVDAYLEAQTEEKVRKVAEEELISKYMTRLVNMENSGLIWMLRNDRIQDLRLMYTLFKDIDKGEDVLRSDLKQEVLERGTELVQNPENASNPVTLINAILALKDKYDKINKFAFHLSPTFPLASTSDADNLAGSTTPTNQFGFGYNTDIHMTQANVGSARDIPSRNPRLDFLTSGAGGTSGSTLMTLTGSTVNATQSGAGSSSALLRTIPDKKFISAVNEAFERFINSFSKSAEYISLYVDKLLRKDFKTTSDDEIDTKLDSIMTLFRYLNEKDVFERYYKQHLTKRLLHAKTVSSDAERSFISKMKTECGYLYTSKMEVMFNDMKLSEDTTRLFRAKVEKEKIDMKGVDFSVSVLTTMSWPISPKDPSVSGADKGKSDVILPLPAIHCRTQFEQYYYAKHDGRRLTWQTSLGTAEMRARFGGGTRTVDLCSVPAYAMCILMLFNKRDSMTCKEIMEATEIPEKELARHLQSLSLAKYRVLTKEPKGKEVTESDKFSFNDRFSSRSRRIRLQVISAAKENDNERNKTRSRIDDDRRPVIDTVIVRIMKHRKILDHVKLVMEVTAQLSSRFQPNPQEIKKRIESLVDREYLERQKDNHQRYQYVA